MSKRQEYNWERKGFRDEQTGTEILQLTGFPTVNHAFYFHVQSFTPDSKTLLFLSYTELRRDATPNIFRVDTDGTHLIQLTDEQGIESAILSPDGSKVFFITGSRLKSVDINTGGEKSYAEIKGVETWINGPNRLHLADTGSISADGKSFVTGRRMLNKRNVILHYDIPNLKGSVLYEHPTGAAHVQFDPYTSERIAFCTAGDERHRNIWTLKRDGTDGRILNLEFGNGHFAWLRKTDASKEIVVMSNTTSPRGAIKYCGVNEKDEKIIAQGKNFWHASPSKDGKWIVADSNWPDEGIYIIQVSTGKMKSLCYPKSSEGHAQWTHPHPFFSPDGKMVVFNSDRTGIPHVYLAKISDEFFNSFNE